MFQMEYKLKFGVLEGVIVIIILLLILLVVGVIRVKDLEEILSTLQKVIGK